jgi:hypothetical protein
MQMKATRRQFLQAGGAAAAVAQIQQLSANDTIQIALIGAGMVWAIYAMRSRFRVKLVAVCDLYDGRRREAGTVGKKICPARAIPRVLSRKDVTQ